MAVIGDSVSGSGFPRYAVLDDHEIRQIHDSSLRVLDEVGIIVQHDRALDLLAQAGARVDHQRQLVRFPPTLVECARKRAPSEFVHAGLTPERNLLMSVNGPTHTRPISGPNLILDIGARHPRRATLQDVESWARVGDALPNLDVMASIHPQDVPQVSCDVHVLAKLLQYTDKPIMMSGYSGKEVRWWVELLDAVPNQVEQRLMGFSSVNSPLVFSQDQCDLALECARYSLPIIVSSPGLVGAQSPVTLAGSLVQINAEMLAAITVIQITYPGVPIVYAGYPAIFDLQWAMTSFAAAEYGLLVAACIELGRYYDLPTAGTGLTTDAIICDQQAGMEKVLAVFLSFLAQPSIIGAAGTLGQCGLSSLEQLVIDDDIFGACRRQTEGIVVTPNTLALDAIARVGPEDHYLEDEHTRRFMHSEYYRSAIANRSDAATWAERGAKDLWEKAAERVRGILDEPEAPKLEPAIVHELEAIVRAADRELEGE